MKSTAAKGTMKKCLIDRRALARHKKRFLKFFPDAFQDERYIDWERTYKWEAHKLFSRTLARRDFEELLRAREYQEIASRALAVESRCNFLFSFEKMALRDAVRTVSGASIFAEGLYQLLYERGTVSSRMIAWIVAVSQLPRKKSRVLSWPIVTFFPFIAQPKKFIIMKPTAMKVAAAELGYDLAYSSTPSITTYERLLDLADQVGEAIADLEPQDYHDLQSFLWTIGSAEYDRLAEELGID
ncbi:MAG: hypothetical protein IPM23_12640 [Candidatus Melainabacteria bacterium]|nr:hypothetical protein [Candidatus Melainabacteria bacterium]